MGEILQIGSDLESIWITIRDAVFRLLGDGSPEDFGCAFIIACSFVDFMSETGRREFDASAHWRNLIHQFREILSKLGLKGDLPSNLNDTFGRDMIFNATSFWRDWHRSD
jgi:hypothetical protein